MSGPSVPVGFPMEIPHRWARELTEAQDAGEEVGTLGEAVDWLLDNEIPTREELYQVVGAILNVYVDTADGMMGQLGLGPN